MGARLYVELGRASPDAARGVAPASAFARACLEWQRELGYSDSRFAALLGRPRQEWHRYRSDERTPSRGFVGAALAIAPARWRKRLAAAALADVLRGTQAGEEARPAAPATTRAALEAAASAGDGSALVDLDRLLGEVAVLSGLLDLACAAGDTVLSDADLAWTERTLRTAARVMARKEPA